MYYMFVYVFQKKCAEKLDWYKTLKGRLGDFTTKQPLLYVPPDIKSKDYISLDFFCLVSSKQWGFAASSSKVFMRFCAKELGTFATCHGPMTPTHQR